jgi:hypothetical protein
LRLVCTGTSGGARNLILGSGCQIEKLYLIQNDLADTVTVKNTAGTGVAIPAGRKQFVFNNGTNVVEAISATVNLATDVTGTLPIANGGTGGSAAPTNGGVAYGTGTAYAFSTAGTSGDALISQGTSAPTWQQVTNSNTVSTIVARDASGDFSAGTITASLSGSSTSCSGNAATATKLQTARTIGGVSFDGTANINLPGVNTAGTQNTSGTAAGLSATLDIDKGGTGQTSYTNGQLLIGNTTSFGLTKATLTGTANRLTVTNGAGSITLNVDATNANTANKVVARDAAGDFSAGIITASLNGTANTAGKLSTASGSAPSFAARAWVNFDGTTNVGGFCTIRDSGNVTSVADNGTGDYTINFTTGMPDDDYCPVFGISVVSDQGDPRVLGVRATSFGVAPTLLSTTQIRVLARGGSNTDYYLATMAIFR